MNVSKQSFGIKGPLAFTGVAEVKRDVCLHISTVYINPRFNRLFYLFTRAYMVSFHQNLSEKALSDIQEVYTIFFPVLISLWCSDKSVDVHHLPLDIPMTEGSLHALFCCRLCCY